MTIIASYINTKLAIVHGNIRYLRTRAELSQRQLAEKTGLNRGNIASYEDEANPATPSLTKLSKIANYFDVNVETIMNVEISDDNYDTLKLNANGVSEGSATYSSNSIMDIIDRLERKHPESMEQFSPLKSMIYKKEERAQEMFEWFKKQLESLK